MTTLIKIGNSHGVRIPKNLIEQLQLRGKRLALEKKGRGLLIKPAQKSAKRPAKPAAATPGEDAYLKAEKEAKAKGIKDPAWLADMDLYEAHIKDDEWEW